MSKRLYVAATRQNEGKTTVSLGLMAALIEAGRRPCYQKPVGQRVIPTTEGTIADEDVVLLKKVFDLPHALADMSPIGIPRGFTERYIRSGEGSEPMVRSILDALGRIEDGADYSIVEGTGHAGVGDVIGLCNASVCKLMDAAAVLVTGGGIGRPIDEIAINMSLFERQGCRVIGVILNKVLPSKLERVTELVRIALAAKGVELLGSIPAEPILSGPTLAQIVEDTSAVLVNGADALGRAVERILIGTSYPHNVMDRLDAGTLLITSGDRDDLILAALSGCIAGDPQPARGIGGVVLTDGLVPHASIMHLIQRTGIPVMTVSEDVYTAAAQIHDLMVKIRPADTGKIDLASRLVRQHVHVDRILQRLDEPG
jgi:BioD-like phosphotransacetylase family protein